MRNSEYENRIAELEAELASVKRRLSYIMTAIDNLPNPIFIKDEGARFLFFNKKYAESFGMAPEKYIGATVLDLDYLPMEDRIRYQSEDVALIEDGRIKNYDVDFAFVDGKLHPSFYWSRGVHDTATGQRGIIGEIVDISKERELQRDLEKALEDMSKIKDRLEQSVEIDAGTGVYNRVLLNRIIGDIAARKSAKASVTSALLCDLDRFKQVNDSFGHLRGDEVLQQVADIIKSECRSEDLPIRYGGDEFLLLLFEAGEKDACAVAERIRKRCETEIKLSDGRVQTLSIGVSAIGEDEDMETVISRLDGALYRAKESGRNRVEKA